VAELRNGAPSNVDSFAVAVLDPESRIHNLHKARRSKLTADFVPTSAWITVRGMARDILTQDDIDRALKEYWRPLQFDALFLFPERAIQAGLRGSYDSWDHVVQLWIKRPVGEPPHDYSPEC